MFKICSTALCKRHHTLTSTTDSVQSSSPFKCSRADFWHCQPTDQTCYVFQSIHCAGWLANAVALEFGCCEPLLASAALKLEFAAPLLLPFVLPCTCGTCEEDACAPWCCPTTCWFWPRFTMAAMGATDVGGTGCTISSFSIWLRSSSKSSLTRCYHPFSKSKKMYLPTSLRAGALVLLVCAVYGK